MSRVETQVCEFLSFFTHSSYAVLFNAVISMSNFPYLLSLLHIKAKMTMTALSWGQLNLLIFLSTSSHNREESRCILTNVVVISSRLFKVVVDIKVFVVVSSKIVRCCC